MARELREADLDAAYMVGRLSACTSENNGDPAIVDDVYELVQKLIASEDLHAGRLDTRAVSLFGAVGFSMTVAFSFGGWPLLEHATKVPHGTVIAILFFLVLVVGIVAGGFALFGVRLRDGHQIVDEEQIFHGEVIAAGKRQIDLRIHVASHLWKIWQDRRAKSELRARAIQRGQWSFGLFLLLILVLAGVTTLSAVSR